MSEVPVYHYIRQSRKGEVKGLGIIMKTIEPDTADGERAGAVIMRDIFSHSQFEVDDRDYWPVAKKD